MGSETKHDLKIWPEHFEAVVSGRKTFEVRADDREYAEGDTLLLREWNPDLQVHTGRTTERRVSHLLRDSAFVRDGFVILSLAAPLAAERGDDDFAQADEYARMLLDDGWAITPDRPTIVLARAYLSLRARPLPDDVRAVVAELVQARDGAAQFGDGWATISIEAVRTLLAHLQRGEG